MSVSVCVRERENLPVDIDDISLEIEERPFECLEENAQILRPSWVDQLCNLRKKDNKNVRNEGRERERGIEEEGERKRERK